MAEDLSKRGKVGDVYRSGSFAKAKKKGLKVSDLKKSQLKRAQTVGGKKITARQVKRATNVANKTNISDTSFVKGQGVMKDGKLLTGSVTLASGKTARYVKGRRVVAGAKKAAPASRPSTSKKVVTTPPKKDKKSTPGPLIEAGVRRNWTHNAAMANKAGSEGFGMANTNTKRTGYWLSPSEKTRREQTQAAAKRNASKPKTSSGKPVPMRLVKNKDGSYRWVKVSK